MFITRRINENKKTKDILMKRLDPIEGISAILARHHLIAFDDLASLRSSFNHRDDITFEDFLIEEGIVDKSDLLKALSEYYRVPALDVVGEFSTITWSD